MEKAEVRTDEELDRVMKRWIGCENFTHYTSGTGRVQRGEYTITYPRLSVLRGYSLPPDDRFDVINIVSRLKKRGGLRGLGVAK